MASSGSPVLKVNGCLVFPDWWWCLTQVWSSSSAHPSASARGVSRLPSARRSHSGDNLSVASRLEQEWPRWSVYVMPYPVLKSVLNQDESITGSTGPRHVLLVPVDILAAFRFGSMATVHRACVASSSGGGGRPTVLRPTMEAHRCPVTSPPRLVWSA